MEYPKDLLQVIIVDNGSTDSTVDIIKCFDVELFREVHIQSSYAARNLGVREARGEIIAFTDADCVVDPDWLKHLIKDWGESSVGCFAGEIEAVQPENIIEKFSEKKDMLKQRRALDNIYLPFAQTANVAYRRKVFDHIGLFNSEMETGGDADLCWRMQNQTDFNILFVPEAIVCHKHRSTVKELFKQYQKYEFAHMNWVKSFPDFPIHSVGWRFLSLGGRLGIAVLLFPVNTFKFFLGRIDITDFLSPFLDCVIVIGALSARLGLKTFAK